MKFLKKVFLSIAFIAVTSLGTTSANAACKVHLGDFDWDSANVHTAIVGYIPVSYTHLRAHETR